MAEEPLQTGGELKLSDNIQRLVNTCRRCGGTGSYTLLDGAEMACAHNICCDLLSIRKQVIELEKAACSCPARVNPEHPVIEQSKHMPDGKLSWGDHAVLQLITATWPDAFVTGTGLWCPGIAQDFDVCLAAKKSDIQLLLGTRVDDKTGSFGSVRVADGVLNIICLTNDYFIKWRAATAMMSALEPIEERAVRHATFEALCGVAALGKVHAKWHKTS